MASVRKREWTYEGQTKEAWIVDYFDAKGTRRQKTFPKKKDADKYRLKVENELREGKHVAPGEDVSMQKLCDLFLVSMEDKARDGRIGRGYYESLKHQIGAGIVPFIGKKKASELTTDDVSDLYSKLCRERGNKPYTAKEKIKVLKLIQNYGIKRRLMSSKPVDDALDDLHGVKRSPIRTFTADEVKSLLDAAARHRPNSLKRTQPALNCIVHLAAFCGLRYGEIVALRTIDIDRLRRVLTIRHSLCRYSGIKAPKTRAGVRDVPLPPHILVMLDKFIADGFVQNEGSFLFRSNKGKVQSHADFHRDMWRPLLERAGLAQEGAEVLHFHALRHFAASWWIDNGMSVLDVTKLVGHAKISTTLAIYAHAVADGQRNNEQIDRMAAALIARPMTIELSPV